jgi:hypothetical protein
MLVHEVMTRRVISLGLCLGLLALGPASLSACAMMMSLPGECAPPVVPKTCEAMHGEEPVAIAAVEGSCCRLTAPAPDAITVTKDAPLPQLSASPVADLPSAELSQCEAPGSHLTDASAARACSPEQARLCVFLI